MRSNHIHTAYIQRDALWSCAFFFFVLLRVIIAPRRKVHRLPSLSQSRRLQVQRRSLCRLGCDRSSKGQFAELVSFGTPLQPVFSRFPSAETAELWRPVYLRLYPAPPSRHRHPCLTLLPHAYQPASRTTLLHTTHESTPTTCCVIDGAHMRANAWPCCRGRRWKEVRERRAGRRVCCPTSGPCTGRLSFFSCPLFYRRKGGGPPAGSHGAHPHPPTDVIAPIWLEQVLAQQVLHPADLSQSQACRCCRVPHQGCIRPRHEHRRNSLANGRGDNSHGALAHVHDLSADAAVCDDAALLPHLHHHHHHGQVDISAIPRPSRCLPACPSPSLP